MARMNSPDVGEPQQVTVLVDSPEGSMHDDDSLSSPSCDDEDMMTVAMEDDVTAQLACAGPVGVAAAAAILSAKRRKQRPHSFETNPSIRKRQQNRLLRKLKQTIDEFSTRVGQQAIVLVAKPNTSYKVFGAKPLQDVIKGLKSSIMEELDTALANQAPPPTQDDPNMFELPPLVIDGIPTPVEQMTQAQLRAFIPLMLKYSTGRGKPGWGRDSTKPPWWPRELPWANVRMDVRSEEDKQKISWTHALRQIVINCYTFHGREDLLPAFSEEDKRVNATSTANSNNTTECAPQTVLHTITNADGSLSIVQVDPNNPIITLPDGTTAQVQGMATIQSGQGGGSTPLHAIQIPSDGVQGDLDLSSITEATLNSEGQIILTGEDGQISGVITVPVSASTYQAMLGLQTGDGQSIVNLPVIQVPKIEPHSGDNVEALPLGGLNGQQMLIQSSGSDGTQVLQVLSLKDATLLSGGAFTAANIKREHLVDQ